MQTLASKAYGATAQRTAGDRQIEIMVFTQITEELEAATADNCSATQWAEALNRNLRLWTILAADLMHPNNSLDKETKKGLLSIAAFVRKATFEILAGSSEISDLISINRTIMAGFGDAQAHPLGEVA